MELAGQRYRSLLWRSSLWSTGGCAQLTCQLVATPTGIPTQHIEVIVSGDMDLQGTLGISKDVPVGFKAIRVKFNLDAPEATPDQYCSVFSCNASNCSSALSARFSPAV
jgi:uncharacterized OsmC-like protein